MADTVMAMMVMMVMMAMMTMMMMIIISYVDEFSCVSIIKFFFPFSISFPTPVR